MSAKSLFEIAKSAMGAAHLGAATEKQVFTKPLHQDGTYVWQIEYVRKEHNGESYLADRLVKHNRATGEKETLGEYDTEYAMADAASTLPGLPMPVLSKIAPSALPARGEKSIEDLGVFRLPAMS
jgi:hypothetical protein